MDLRNYLRLLRQSWIVIAACTVFGLSVGVVASLLITPTYTAQSQLFVAIQSSGSASDMQLGNTFAQERISSYVAATTTPAVLQPVIDELGLNSTPDELASQLAVAPGDNTVMMTIAAEDPSPDQAAVLASAVADSLIQVVSEIEAPTQGGPSPVKLTVLAPATVPAEPSAPDFLLNIVLGLLSGLVVGVVAAFLRSYLGAKVSGEEDLRRITDLSLLGSVAYDSGVPKNPLSLKSGGYSPRAESFRQIRTNLQFARVSRQAKTVMVTSSVPDEGKSTVAVNIAAALAESGQRVALIDADLRRPRLDNYLGLPGTAGLSTALLGTVEPEQLLQPFGEEGLYVMTSGRIPLNPSELLGSSAMQRLVTQLESRFDVIVIDTPAMLPVADAAVLAQLVDGVVLVVGARTVKTQELRKTINSLAMVDADLLGVVLNGVSSGTSSAGNAYYTAENRQDTEPDQEQLPDRSLASSFDAKDVPSVREL